MRRAALAFASSKMSPYRFAASRAQLALRNGGAQPKRREYSDAAEAHRERPPVDYTQLFGQRKAHKGDEHSMERLSQTLAKRGGRSERVSKEQQRAPQGWKRKRQGGTLDNFPPARRVRGPTSKSTAKPTPLDYDVETIERTMNLPSRDTVPGISKELLTSPKGPIVNRMRNLGKIDTLNTVFGQKYHRCVLRCNFKHGDSVDAIGEGINKKLAEKAAFLHLLAKFHESGILPEVLGLKSTLDNETISEEKDAKLDVYNYAARYGAIPTVTVSESLDLSGRKVSEATVEMAEHGIKVSKKSRQRIHAEIGAMILFKEAAEKHQSAQGLGALIVKDSNSLTSSNARQFFQFYKYLRVSDHVEVKVREVNKGGLFEAQFELNGEPIGSPVGATSKKKTEDTAYLIAAVEMVKKEPDLLPAFLKALRAGNGQILRPLNPITMEIESRNLDNMKDAIESAKAAGLIDEGDSLEAEEEKTSQERRRRMPPSVLQMERRSEELLERYNGYQTREDLEELRSKRGELPMSQYAEKVLEIVQNNTYSIIIGATGSGKTTQVPQIILDQAIEDNEGGFCKVICTQPRRIAAISVSKRVADERAEPIGDAVGYHVRQNAKLPRDAGSITYCTTGILLQQLQHSPDEVLDSVSHLVIDEVHERDLFIDFLLVVLKTVMNSRLAAGKKVPKIVLMSATMDSKLFASYFNSVDISGKKIDCPTLSVPGRTFPVREQYLNDILSTLESQHERKQLQVMNNDKDTTEYIDSEKSFAQSNVIVGEAKNADVESFIDWKKTTTLAVDGEAAPTNEAEEGLVPLSLIATTIAHIAETTNEGAVLVFLPGLDEITKTNDLLRQGNILNVDFGDESKYKIYMLHSSIQGDQQGVFESVPEGCRKIILGTNIAETSITIPEVQYVVDSGKIREKRYDQIRRITKLQCTWVSKSNSKQRAGRAGRVQNGNYYALFSKERFESLRAIGLPELLRSDLQDTCLQVKSQALKAPIREFIGDAIEPPPPTAVDTAVNNLIDLDALTEDEKLTSLGRLLATLPVHPSLGKMIVLGIVFRCLDPMIILGAASAERPLFVAPPDARTAASNAKSELAVASKSDHLALLNAFNQLRDMQQSGDIRQFQTFAMRHFVHQGAFKRIQSTCQEIEGILADAGLISRPSGSRFLYGDELLNENSLNLQIIKALTVAGLRPNIAVATGEMTHRTQGEQNCLLHPSSVNAPKNRYDSLSRGGDFAAPLYTFSTLAKSNDGHSTFLRESTQVTPLMTALFGGHLSAPPESGGTAASRNVVTVDGWLPFYIRSSSGGHRDGPRTVKAFRRALELVQLEAFRDLSKRQYLARDRVRGIFAACLVDIFGNSKQQARQGRAGGSPRDSNGASSWQEADAEAEDYLPPDPWSRADRHSHRSSAAPATYRGRTKGPTSIHGNRLNKWMEGRRG